MVRALLQLARRQRWLLDASDALAVAICHLHRGTARRIRHKDWKSFVAAHPERIRP